MLVKVFPSEVARIRGQRKDWWFYLTRGRALAAPSHQVRYFNGQFLLEELPSMKCIFRTIDGEKLLAKIGEIR